jgi:hypothetical protein
MFVTPFLNLRRLHAASISNATRDEKFDRQIKEYLLAALAQWQQEAETISARRPPILKCAGQPMTC